MVERERKRAVFTEGENTEQTDRKQLFIFKSLILAQDERWRRA